MLMFLIVFSIMLQSAFGQESLVMEQLTEKGSVKVQLEWPKVYPEEIYNVNVKFLDPDTDELLDNVTIEYNVSVTKADVPIELYANQLTDTGMGSMEVMFPENDTGISQVTIEVYTINNGSEVIVLDEIASFSVEVVPEFGVIVVTVLTISITCIIIFGKTKLSYTKSI